MHQVLIVCQWGRMMEHVWFASYQQQTAIKERQGRLVLGVSGDLSVHAEDHVWRKSCSPAVFTHTAALLSASAVCSCRAPHTGHVPAEDPHHSAVFGLHAGEEVGLLPVALAAPAHGRSHSSAGTTLQSPRTIHKHTGGLFLWGESDFMHSSDVLTSTVAHRDWRGHRAEGPVRGLPVRGPDGRADGLRVQWLCRSLLWENPQGD